MMYSFHKKQQYVSGVILILFLSANGLCCKNAEDSQIDDSTRIFANYMKNMHGIELPKDLTYFIVIPENIGCEGCKKMTFRYFLSRKLPSNCKIIAGKGIKGHITSKFDYQYYIDTVDKIERLKLNTQTTALIKVEDRKVISNTEINPSNLDSILSSLNNLP